MLDEIIYLDDDTELPHILDGFIEIIDMENQAIKFSLLNVNEDKRADIVVYRKNNVYYIKDIYNHQEEPPKEIQNEKDMRRTLILIMQACEENGDYKIEEAQI